MQTDFEKLLPQVVALCRKAGAAIMDFYAHSQITDISYKDDNSPLTQADLQSDQILKHGLTALANYPYLSEESATVPYSERAHWETYWLVDPLDGTKEFLKKTNEFTVNVALIHKDQLVLGVVYAPALNVCYFGTNTTGSFSQQDNEEQKKLPVHNNITNNITIVISRSHASNDELKMIAPLITNKTISTVSVGSSLKFCLLAEGSADLYPRSGPTCEWDTAAGHAILLFSGGMVIDNDTKQTLCYNKENLLNNRFIAVSRQTNIKN